MWLDNNVGYIQQVAVSQTDGAGLTEHVAKMNKMEMAYCAWFWGAAWPWPLNMRASINGMLFFSGGA